MQFIVVCIHTKLKRSILNAKVSNEKAFMKRCIYYAVILTLDMWPCLTITHRFTFEKSLI